MCRFKECDRVHVVATELQKLEAEIEEGEDFLRITGTEGLGLHLAEGESYHDHRIAMMLVVCACGIIMREGGSEGMIINDMEWISVSYPSFIEDFSKLGVSFTEVG